MSIKNAITRQPVDSILPQSVQIDPLEMILMKVSMLSLIHIFVPFGYYIPLSAYEVANWDEATHTVTYGTRPFNWGLLAFTLALGAVLFALAWRKVQDEEV